MKFLSYKITQIDEERGHLHVTFVFDTETKVKVFDYRAKVGYDNYELRDVDEKYKDKEGRIQTRTVKKTVVTLLHKPAFTVDNPLVLDTELKEWARAYMVGKAQEDMYTQKVSDTVKSLIGKVNTTQI